ncbi:MAG: uroporphyrinogen decarboxylase family protein [Spirochaetales bacterium]|nr:uroporphyrinogen decarboxylase family protein [Spirochaetales bacterium]
MAKEFDTSKADAQGTAVRPLKASDFDRPRYREYEASLNEGCRAFQNASSGVAVYRRFRVPEVFSWGCRDRKMSLEWQLAALQASVEYKADIPNFLEPWYGIGVVSNAFGIPYVWKEGQAPAVESSITSARDAINRLECPVAESEAGREVLERIEYFLDQTGGQIPMSLTDSQSPLNVASSYVLNAESFMYEIFDHPEDLQELLELIGSLEKDFIRAQADLIGDALVKPGHGFASCREFKGLGFSDDNVLMFSDENYNDLARGPLCDVASLMDGPVFHSCGDWSGRTDLIKAIPGVLMADAAVGAQTDPSPNNPELLGKAFAGSGITLHVRIVGDSQVVEEEVSRLWQKDLKLITATYCETPEDQMKAYEAIHRICG